MPVPVENPRSLVVAALGAWLVLLASPCAPAGPRVPAAAAALRAPAQPGWEEPFGGLAAGARSARRAPASTGRAENEVEAAAAVLSAVFRWYAIGVGLALVLAALAGLSLRGFAGAALAEPVPAGVTAARFMGSDAELRRLLARHIPLLVATLGLSYPWARAALRSYRFRHTSFGGQSFGYDARGKELLKRSPRGTWLLVPLLVALLLYAAAVRTAEEELAVDLAIGALGSVWLVRQPLRLVAEEHFDASHTTWGGVRFRFTGEFRDAWRTYLVGTLFLVLSAGYGLFWHRCNVRRFRLTHTRLGASGFTFHGEGQDLFRSWMHGWLLSVLTLGLFLPWHIARLHRFRVENTTFRGRAFESRLTGSLVLAVGAPALLASLLTLGLALPWAMNRWYRLLTDTTWYAGAIDVATLCAATDEDAQEAGAEAQDRPAAAATR